MPIALKQYEYELSVFFPIVILSVQSSLFDEKLTSIQKMIKKMLLKEIC